MSKILKVNKPSDYSSWVGLLVNLSGWAALFHPDILQGTSLENDINNFSFFDYRINEALHMTSEERNVMISLIRQLKNENSACKNRLISGMNSSEAAYSLGFGYPQHFARTFKRITGETPTQYIETRLSKSKVTAMPNTTDGTKQSNSVLRTCAPNAENRKYSSDEH